MLFLLLAFLPLETSTNRVDVIELNHFYDCQTGLDVYAQWLFWDLKDGEWVLVDWKHHHDELAVGNLLLIDGKVVKAGRVTETWNDWDRELAAREKTPQEKRKKLR